MMHEDEQGIVYKRHLEKLNISYLLEYNFPSRYSCNPTELLNNIIFNKMLLRKLLNLTFTQEVASMDQTRLIIKPLSINISKSLTTNDIC
jgi:hypothetical protein